MHDAAESLQPQLKQKKIKLNIKTDPTVPTIELDIEQVYEMTVNLIINAIDNIDAKGKVTVETRYLQQERSIQVSVTDNGSGMSDEMKGKIFTPLEPDKGKFGTGLGMPLAQQIVQQHKGKIDIDTEHGKGTTFTITLPAKTIEWA